jgi:hypothetical protein
MTTDALPSTSLPSAWHYDRVFRWMVIGAGVSLTIFVLRPPNPATPQPIASTLSIPASLGPTYGASGAGAPLAPPMVPALPRIALGRSLNAATITPAPTDGFGTVPSAGRK